MTREEAIKILDPETTAEALAEIEYYGGFHGKEAKIAAVNEACVLAAEALRAQIEREKNNDPLTLDELREMDGDPVWAEREDGYKHYSGWALVDVRWKAQNMVYVKFLRGPDAPCDLLIKNGGKIYRRKPEETP